MVGSTTLLGCDANGTAAAPAQSAPARTNDPLVVEPTTLDMGDLVPDVSVTKRVKLTNHSSKPIKITSAVADCSCTTPTWPTEPIAPGATVETDISIKPGPKQGVTLTKRVTFAVEDAAPVFLTVIGKVGLFIEQSTDMIRAPADDFASPPAEKITLRGADNTPFKIQAVEPACLTADDAATGMNHSLTVDWQKWRELKKPLKFTILTDHPKTPELVVMVRRTVSSTPAPAPAPAAAPTAAPTTPPPAQPAAAPSAPPTQIGSAQAKKPRQYKLVLPTVYPGAMIEFPPLGEFVKGEKRRSFPKDKIMVFEFFSTTCGHCAEAAPAIEALVEEYMPKGWEFISITAEDAQKVRDWLAKPENADMVKQSVALDPGSKAQKALQDRTFQVLTPRFFVVRNGLVLWYGHPDSAEEPFQKIADGSWNPESVRQEFIDNAVVARARNQTGELLRKCEADGKWQDLFELFDSIAEAVPSRASTFELQKFGTMIGPANMSAEGYAYGRSLAVKYATDIASLRTLARTTLNSPQVKVRDIDWAFTIATQADALGKSADARAAEIVALAYFSKGDRENAVKNMERAIGLQDNVKAKKLYQDQLAKYKTDEPKPVPYTPPAPKPGASPTAPAGGTATTPAAPPAGSDPSVDGGNPH